MRIVATTDQHGLPMCGEPFVGIGALYIYNGQKKKNHIRFMLNQTGCHRFSLLLSLRATWKFVKGPLAEITVTKPKSNLSRNEVTALKELKNNFALNL